MLPPVAAYQDRSWVLLYFLTLSSKNKQHLHNPVYSKHRPTWLLIPAYNFAWIVCWGWPCCGGINTLVCMQAEDELLALSAEQQNVVDLILAGRNVFFTGCAGLRTHITCPM